jgi:hypothetical protein
MGIFLISQRRRKINVKEEIGCVVDLYSYPSLPLTHPRSYLFTLTSFHTQKWRQVITLIGQSPHTHSSGFRHSTTSSAAQSLNRKLTQCWNHRSGCAHAKRCKVHDLNTTGHRQDKSYKTYFNDGITLIWTIVSPRTRRMIPTTSCTNASYSCLCRTRASLIPCVVNFDFDWPGGGRAYLIIVAKGNNKGIETSVKEWFPGLCPFHPRLQLIRDVHQND